MEKNMEDIKVKKQFINFQISNLNKDKTKLKEKIKEIDNEIKKLKESKNLLKSK